MSTRPSKSRAATGSSTAAAPRGRKRASEGTEVAAGPKPAKRTKKAAAKEASEEEEEEEEGKEQEVNTRPPRLTTPDLEYDYDRSQLRDPRPTPGRVGRPRLEDNDVDEAFKARFYIPKVVRPKRVSQYDTEWDSKEALSDPTHMFHDLHVCNKKGPDGSPTYDGSGFQLDYKKVARWLKPKAYNKNSIVNGMTRHLEEESRLQKLLFEAFFVGGKPPEDAPYDLLDYVKDHVSKDLGVPWHQINAKQVKKWQDKGFAKVKASEWWREPNAEEKKRMLNMHKGADLRKNL